MSPVKRPVTAKEALARLESLCARAEHCSHEMREKLRTWGIAPADAEQVMHSLLRNKYVDDSRFVRAFVNDKVRFARWGRRKIAQALAMKRIDSALVREALADVDIDIYASNLEDILNAKMRSLGDEAATYEGRTKAYRFGVSRGYEPDLVANILRKLIINQ